MQAVQAVGYAAGSSVAYSAAAPEPALVSATQGSVDQPAVQVPWVPTATLPQQLVVEKASPVRPPVHVSLAQGQVDIEMGLPEPEVGLTVSTGGVPTLEAKAIPTRLGAVDMPAMDVAPSVQVQFAARDVRGDSVPGHVVIGDQVIHRQAASAEAAPVQLPT
ncbi:MAG: hypothetical protein GY772_14625, partial [bacterium]|nr:hypothetical protein [bacterium]